jgi:hypothetical protein
MRALETIPSLSIHYGHYLTHVTRMPLANPRRGGARTVEVVKTEEKGSDVNLATYLLLDAFRRDCDVAVVISNDSDLKLPIEIAQSELGSGSASPTRTHRLAAVVRFNRRSSSNCAPQRSAPASSRRCSRTPRVRSASRHAGSSGSAPERRDPPKRASHPATEAAGGMHTF